VLVVGELGGGEADCQTKFWGKRRRTYMREGLVVASWGL
jgi:hypothetical protein